MDDARAEWTMPGAQPSRGNVIRLCALLGLLLALPFTAPALPTPKSTPPGGIPLRTLQDLANANQVEALKWNTDLETALALAARHNKPVLVYFTMPQCAWCRRLDAEVLQHPEVRKRLSSFVLVKLDLAVDEKAAARFRIRSTPTLLLLSPEGRETQKLEGYIEKAELLTVLIDALGNQAAKQDERIAGLIEALRAQKFSDSEWPALLLAMADERYRETITQLVTKLKPLPRTPLVEQLQHPFLAVRLGALELLEELTGEDFGFNPWLDTPAQQAEAVGKWKAWAAKPEAAPAAQHFQTLTADEVAGYLRDLLGDDADRATRARRMLQRGGASAMTGLNTFSEANPGLPAGTLGKLREIRYSLILPPLHGVESASLAHRLVFGNLDVRLRTLREVAAAKKRAVPVLKDFLTDPEPLVRETTVDALVTAGGRSVVTVLEQHLGKEQDANVTFLILKQLGNLPSKRGLAVLIGYLENANEDFVVIALESVGRLKSDTVAPQVEKCLADARWRVRVAALKAAQTLRLKTLAPRIIKLLEDKDTFVRGSAVEALATVAAKESAPQLEAMFLLDDSVKGPIFRALIAAELPVSSKLLDSLKGKPASVWLGILQTLEDAEGRAVALLESAARHPDADVACAALRLMAHSGLKESAFQHLAAEQIRAGERRRVLTLLETTELEEKTLFRHNPDARKVDLVTASGAVAPAGKSAQQKELDSIFSAFDKPAAPAAAPAAPAAPPKGKASAADDIFAAFNTQPAAASLDFFQEFLTAGRKALNQAADRELSLAAATFLIHLGELSAVPSLLGGLDQLTEERRAKIAHNLGRIRKQEAVPLIRRLLADPTVEVREQAARALLADGANEQCLDILFTELTRPNAVLKPHEAYDAVHDLARRRNAGAGLAGRLLDLLKQSKDEQLQVFALIIATTAWDAASEAAVRPFLTSPNPWHRRAAYYALGRHEAEKFAGLVAKVAQDSSEHVRAVIPALYRGADSYSARWVHHFDQQKTETSYDYAGSFGRERNARPTPAVKEVLKQLTTDPSDLVRFQALYSLLTYQEPVDLTELTAILERLPRSSALLEQMTEYVSGNYQTLGKNFAVVLPYLNLAGRYRGQEQAMTIQAHFGVNEEDEELPSVFAPAKARQRVEASFLPVARAVAAAQNLRLIYFYKPGCAVCEQARRRLESLRELFPDLVVTEYDITKTAALLVNETLSEKFGVPANVRLVAPAVFAGAGYLLKEDITVERLGSLLSRSATVPVANWLVEPQQDLAAAQVNIAQRYEQAGLGLILAAGFLDGINPCAFATIIFLLSYLQVTRKTPREIAQIGIAYILGVFAAYFVIGLGLLKVAVMLTQIRWLGGLVNQLMAGLALVIMVLCVRDGIYCLRGRMADMTLQLPDLLKHQIHRLIRTSVRQAHFVLMAFLLGVAISLLELACTGQVYLPTITYMIQQGGDGRGRPADALQPRLHRPAHGHLRARLLGAAQRDPAGRAPPARRAGEVQHRRLVPAALPVPRVRQAVVTGLRAGPGRRTAGRPTPRGACLTGFLPEIRSPKSEIRKKAEARSPKRRRWEVGRPARFHTNG